MMTKSTWGTEKPAISSLARSTRRTCTPLPCTPTFHACTEPPPPLSAIRAGPRRGSKGPICIRTWNRGDASSIISLGISHRLRASINSPSSRPLSLSSFRRPSQISPKSDRFPFRKRDNVVFLVCVATEDDGRVEKRVGARRTEIAAAPTWKGGEEEGAREKRRRGGWNALTLASIFERTDR